jgi:hypothetical protein
MTGVAEEVGATIAPLLAHVGTLAPIAMPATHVWDQLPRPANDAASLPSP